MKAFKILRGLVLLGGILLSACAAAPASQNATDTSNTVDENAVAEVVFTGEIENIDGDQWVIDGQTIRVDPSVVQDGPFLVGDTVKVEALVGEDGTVTVKRVESPSAADLAEATSTEAPVIFDDSGSEAVGMVEAITDTSITLGGLTYNYAPGAEIKGAITVGTIVKLHFVANADGSLSVREVETVDPTQIQDNNNGNDDNSNDTNFNDNSSNDNSNDDNSNANGNGNNSNGNDDSTNDNHNGGNSSDDDSSNDDDGDEDDDNSNDSNGNG